MDLKRFNTNKAELLVDKNGNGVQRFPLGGRTISVQDDTFRNESALMRLANTGSAIARISLKDAYWEGVVKDGSDIGMAILPLTAIEVAALEVGKVWQVDGALEVTFLYDRNVRIKDNVPSYPDFAASSIEQLALGEEEYSYDSDTKTVTFEGLIPFVPTLKCNAVGLCITPSLSPSSFPDAIFTVTDYQCGKPMCTPLKKVVDTDGKIKLNLKVVELPFISEIIIAWLPSNPSYTESFAVCIEESDDNSLQIG